MAPSQKAGSAWNGLYRCLPRRLDDERGMAVWKYTGWFTTLIAVSRLRAAAKRRRQDDSFLDWYK